MIIDSHVHIGNSIGFIMPEEAVLASMERYHIDYSLVSNSDSIEYDQQLNLLPPGLQVSQVESLKRTLRLAALYPNKIGVLPWIKPATEELDEEFIRLVEDNIRLIRGIKVHPFFSNIDFDDPRLEPYYQFAERHHLPVLTHTATESVDDPIKVYHMAVKYPKVIFILGHMGLGSDNQAAIDLMEEADNLYADTTWVPLKSTLQIIRRFGSKRILFGSDNPIDGVDTYLTDNEGNRSLYQQYFHELKEMIDEDAYNDLMYRNAIRIFHLEDLFHN